MCCITTNVPRTQMRDRFWLMFFNLKFRERFYNCHSKRSRRINLLASGTTLVVSFASTLLWSNATDNSYLAVVWALLIALAQLFQSLRDLFPWGKQLSVLEYFLPELQKLVLDIENTWNLIDFDPNNWDTLKIDQARAEFNRRFVDLEQKYIGSVHFSEGRRIQKKAAAETRLFFSNRYKLSDS